LSGMTELERRETLAWVGENLPLVRQSVSGQRILYSTLVTAFVVGLAAYVGGYLLKASVTTEPLGLVADLLYALGYALWTGVVVVVFVQVFPEVKRRQYKQALDAYETAQREKARAGSDQASGDDGAPTAR
jgi:zinc transporter ZupT